MLNNMTIKARLIMLEYGEVICSGLRELQLNLILATSCRRRTPFVAPRLYLKPQAPISHSEKRI